VSPVVETGSRTGEVEIQIPNKSGALRAGMMARVNLTAARVSSAITVPSDSVIIDQVTGGKFVMVMNGKMLQRHDVQVGIQSGDDIQITSGLAAGDRVVVGPMPAENGSGTDSGGGQPKQQGKGKVK